MHFISMFCYLYWLVTSWMFVLIFWSHNKWGEVANTIRFTFILDWSSACDGTSLTTVCENVCAYAHFFIILTTYCCTQKSTGENVTKDNNSIVYNDVLFHTTRRYHLGIEQKYKCPDCNVKKVHTIMRPK